MIVRLCRPVLPPSRNLLVLYAPGVVDLVMAPDDLLQRLDGASGYFEAEQVGDDWDILDRVGDPGWTPG